MNESDKMLEIIHENCRKEREKRNISKIENKKNLHKGDKKLMFILVFLFIAMLVSFVIYNEKSIKNCMKTGRSEIFCRYAGE